jgi:hypothetical protein
MWSATMSDLQAIFGALKPLLQAHQPPLVPKTDTERYFDLWSLKPVVKRSSSPG